MKGPKLEQKLPQYLTIDEVDRLLNIQLLKPVDYRNKAMLELIYATGMRVSELLSLELNQIDFDECFVRVVGKGRKERIIPIADTALHYLSLYIYEYRKYLIGTSTNNLIFFHDQNRAFFFCLFFETGFPCVIVLAVLELALIDRLASYSQRFTWLCLLSAGIKGVHHHRPARTRQFKLWFSVFHL